MIADFKQSNRLLARASMVTSVGDFLSLFSVLVLTHRMTGSIAIAAYVAPIKSLGIAVGGATLPRVLNLFPSRKLLLGTQFFSAALALIMACSVSFYPSIWLLGTLLLCLTILKQYFDGVREHISKSLGGLSEQRTLQAEIMQAFYGAQVIGPLLALALIHSFGPVVPLWIDALSFLFAGFVLMPVPEIEDGHSGTYSIWKPLTYLRQNKPLLLIFLIRSVGFWVPVGLFNYFLFSVVTEKYGRDVLDSAWVYIAIGVGASMAATWLKTQRNDQSSWISHHHWSDAGIASAALMVLAVTRLFFLELPNFALAILVVVVSGICSGLNAVTTQALRRRLATAAQFPEVVGLELVVGRFVDWVVATVAAYAVLQGQLSISQGVLLSAGFLVILAWVQGNRMLQNRSDKALES